MSQHDFNIANQSFPATRTDLNNALVALASNSSGDAEPATKYANQWWYETDTNTLKLRNEANDAWISIAVLDQSGNAVQSITTAGLTLGSTAISATGTEINQLDAITRGSILYGNASGATARLAAGTADTFLKSDGTDLSWATINTGGALPTIPNWSNPTNTYTTSGTWSKGSLADDAEVWFYLLGGGGGGTGGPNSELYTNGGEGGRAILIHATASIFNNATYVVGAGKAGHNNVAANFVGNHSTLTLADGRVFDGSVVGASAILPSSTSTYFQVTVGDAVSLVIKAGVTDASRAFSSGRYPHSGTYNSIFGGGAGRSSTYAASSTGAGGTSVYAGAGGYGTGGGNGAANTGTPTAGTYPGGGGGSQNAYYGGAANGMAGANGNVRVYHV